MKIDNDQLVEFLLDYDSKKYYFSNALIKESDRKIRIIGFNDMMEYEFKVIYWVVEGEIRTADIKKCDYFAWLRGIKIDKILGDD